MTTLAVLGINGGTGATTLSAVLFQQAAGPFVAARAGPPAVLVDTDPSGGADALLQIDQATGLRWPALEFVKGPLEAPALLEALPVTPWGSVLSAGDAPAGTALVPETVTAALKSLPHSVPTILNIAGPALHWGALSSLVDAGVLVVRLDENAILEATRWATSAQGQSWLAQPARLYIIGRPAHGISGGKRTSRTSAGWPTQRRSTHRQAQQLLGEVARIWGVHRSELWPWTRNPPMLLRQGHMSVDSVVSQVARRVVSWATAGVNGIR